MKHNKLHRNLTRISIVGEIMPNTIKPYQSESFLSSIDRAQAIQEENRQNFSSFGDNHFQVRVNAFLNSPQGKQPVRVAFDQRDKKIFHFFVVVMKQKLSLQDISDLASQHAWEYIEIYLKHTTDKGKPLGDNGQYDQVLCQAITSRENKARKVAKLILQRGIVSPKIRVKVATVPRYKDILRKGYTGLFQLPDNQNKWGMVKITDVKTEGDQPLVKIQYQCDLLRNKFDDKWINLNSSAEVERFFPKFLFTEGSTCSEEKKGAAMIINTQESKVSVKYKNGSTEWIDLDDLNTPTRFPLKGFYPELRKNTHVITQDPKSEKSLLDAYCQTDHIDPEIIQLLINKEENISDQKLNKLLFLTIMESTVGSGEIIECLVNHGARLTSEQQVEIAENEKFDGLHRYLQTLIKRGADGEAKMPDDHALSRYEPVLCQALSSLKYNDAAQGVVGLLLEHIMVDLNIRVKVEKSTADPRYKDMLREGYTGLYQHDNEWHPVKITYKDIYLDGEPTQKIDLNDAGDIRKFFPKFLFTKEYIEDFSTTLIIKEGFEQAQITQVQGNCITVHYKGRDNKCDKWIDLNLDDPKALEYFDTDKLYPMLGAKLRKNISVIMPDPGSSMSLLYSFCQVHGNTCYHIYSRLIGKGATMHAQELIDLAQNGNWLSLRYYLSNSRAPIYEPTLNKLLSLALINRTEQESRQIIKLLVNKGARLFPKDWGEIHIKEKSEQICHYLQALDQCPPDSRKKDDSNLEADIAHKVLWDILQAKKPPSEKLKIIDIIFKLFEINLAKAPTYHDRTMLEYASVQSVHNPDTWGQILGRLYKHGQIFQRSVLKDIAAGKSDELAILENFIKLSVKLSVKFSVKFRKTDEKLLSELLEIAINNDQQNAITVLVEHGVPPDDLKNLDRDMLTQAIEVISQASRNLPEKPDINTFISDVLQRYKGINDGKIDLDSKSIEHDEKRVSEKDYKDSNSQWKVLYKSQTFFSRKSKELKELRYNELENVENDLSKIKDAGKRREFISEMQGLELFTQHRDRFGWGSTYTQKQLNKLLNTDQKEPDEDKTCGCFPC